MKAKKLLAWRRRAGDGGPTTIYRLARNPDGSVESNFARSASWRVAAAEMNFVKGALNENNTECTYAASSAADQAPRIIDESEAEERLASGRPPRSRTGDASLDRWIDAVTDQTHESLKLVPPEIRNLLLSGIAQAERMQSTREQVNLVLASTAPVSGSNGGPPKPPKLPVLVCAQPDDEGGRGCRAISLDEFALQISESALYRELVKKLKEQDARDAVPWPLRVWEWLKAFPWRAISSVAGANWPNSCETR